MNIEYRRIEKKLLTDREGKTFDRSTSDRELQTYYQGLLGCVREVGVFDQCTFASAIIGCYGKYSAGR